MTSHDDDSGGSPITVLILQYCPAKFQIISQNTITSCRLLVTSHRLMWHNMQQYCNRDHPTDVWNTFVETANEYQNTQIRDAFSIHFLCYRKWMYYRGEISELARLLQNRQDSKNGIVTTTWSVQLRNWVDSWHKDYSLPQNVQTSHWAQAPTCSMGTGVVSQG